MPEKLYSIKESTMTAMADTVRQITGSSGTITGDEIGDYVVANLPNSIEVEQATPSISVSSSGKITASATQTAGYVSAGTKSATKQLTTQAAKTVTPSTSSQTAIAKNVYTTGAVTVAAIPSKYEDVGTETSAYTSKIASLESAVTALETELANKASGGSAEYNTLYINTVTPSSGDGIDGDVWIVKAVTA